ncbi:hypothetical protein SAMN05421736_12242 [Evansella caseinilytica]|uniref:Uncharacterized protein n=1 Tax=Evansella caseinilytica TaxID=1503961 RepID=A0A1H3UJP3_9BACI|nr:hypothetical protein SAMN05421736_12242 [Evansella caseinilytica]
MLKFLGMFLMAFPILFIALKMGPLYMAIILFLLGLSSYVFAIYRQKSRRA